MLGLLQTDDQVVWTDGKGAIRHGVVITLTDDELWADVREMGQAEIIQLPTSILHAID